MSTRDLIQKAFDQGKLRYAPDALDFTQDELTLELQRTPWTGTEFGYDPKTDEITFAWRSIDGADIDPDEFLQELGMAVGTKVGSWEAGDLAYLTVPSRDSSGFSKRDIGRLTIPVVVVDVHPNSVEIRPQAGAGTARVKADRLKPREGPEPASVFDVISDIMHSFTLAMLVEGVHEAVVKEVTTTVDDYVVNNYGED